MMTRRTMLFVLAALAGVPRALLAQPAAAVRRIGYLDSMPANDPDGTRWRDAFLQGLRDLGWIPGRNIEIEYRPSGGGPEQFSAAAAEISRQNVSVIVTAGEPLIHAAQRANPSTPIVMAMVGDAVGAGFAKTLARPGGNVTGLSNVALMTAKWLELLREIAPRATRMAVLRNLANPTHDKHWSAAEAGAATLGMSVLSLGYRVPGEIEKVLADALRQKAAALLVLADPIAFARHAAIAEFALKNRLLSMFLWREQVVRGGLVSYGPSRIANFRRAATFVDKILRGANPAELPIEQARKFELVINLKTAKALGLKVPQSVLLRADEVIE